MGTAKIILAANSPGALHRLKETLSGLEVHVAIRLRDVAKAVKQDDFALLVLCLGFAERSAVEFLQSLHDERGIPRLPVVCIACDETRAASRESESRLRAAGARDYLELRSYPTTASGNAELLARLLASARIGVSTQRARLGLPAPARITPVSRTLYRAALIVGGVERLARQLEAPEAALRRWIQGEEEPPDSVFLAALEVVLLDMERGSGQPT